MVNQAAARWAGRRLGTVVTLRDHTELRALVSELKTIRGFAEALSAQAHESANQLHTVISLIELGRAEQALAFATTELAVAQQLTDPVVGGVGEPEVAALVLGKAAEAGERGVDLVVADDVDLPAGRRRPAGPGHDRGQPARQRDRRGAGRQASRAGCGSAPRTLGPDPACRAGAELRVADSGPGWTAEADQRVFERGYTTKPTDRRARPRHRAGPGGAGGAPLRRRRGGDQRGGRGLHGHAAPGRRSPSARRPSRNPRRAERTARRDRVGDGRTSEYRDRAAQRWHDPPSTIDTLRIRR